MKRILGICVLLCTPLLGHGALYVVLAFLCARTVYQGLRAGIVYGTVAVLAGIELLYGLDVGVLSLAYLTATLLVTALRRFIALPPWTAQRGWRLLDAFQAVMMAYLFYWMARISGILVGYIVYGYDQPYRRFLLLVHGTDVGWAFLIIVVTLVLLRRIDEPFRRRIIFGT
jgi:hypothetical protein